MSKKIGQIIERITEHGDPVSVFLYGSRARADFLDDSDYEIGVLYKKEKKISRTALKAMNPYTDVVIYPFVYEDFLEYKIDTPFPERIYLRELIESGKTLYGEHVLEALAAPQITTLDLLQRINFDIGMALSAVLSKRNGDNVTAATAFSKSSLFGIRCLIILEQQFFPLTYDAIYEASKGLDLGEYHDVLAHALAVRKGEEVEEAFLYKNLSLLNKIVRKRIVELFEKNGNRVLI